MILAGILALGGYYGYYNYVVPTNQYKAAVTLGEQGKYEDAIKEFRELGAFKDSQTKVKEMKYQWAGKADLDKSISLYEELGDYKDAQQKLRQPKHRRRHRRLLQNWQQHIVNAVRPALLFLRIKPLLLLMPRMNMTTMR